jgi:hypothetical protein
MVTATTELLEEYKINFIDWPTKEADLSPYRVLFL